MGTNYSVSLERVIKEFSYETLYMPRLPSELSVTSQDVNRPALLLADRDDYFDPERVQILGLSELEYLKTLSAERQEGGLERLTSRRPPFILITRGLACPPALRTLAEKYEVPLLRTEDATSSCMSALISFLGTELAERITRHGVLVEVYGEGVLLVGESGIGKSETALELIKRGHRLVADDAVEVKQVSKDTLLGTAPEMIRYYMELRGIGVINVRHIYGVGAVKPETGIDVVVRMEAWKEGKIYDRLGLVDETEEILGVKVPLVTIPVTPGRNLAVILELAAMNNRQKKMGYNAAQALAEAHDLAIDNGTF